MKRGRERLVSVALAVFGALILAGAGASTGETQSGAACLHGSDETAAEKQRRGQGVLLSRQIHNQQQRTRASGGKFVPVSALSSLSQAAGFEVSLVTDGATYAFAVKDTQDPCGLAFFSDHKGLIYEGKPLQ